MTFRELIARWPTIAAFARECGIGYECARQMKNRDSIDQVHWVAVLEAAKSRRIVDERGRPISPTTLMQMSARQKRQPKKNVQKNEGRAVAA
jgi:hypothetical protein